MSSKAKRLLNEDRKQINASGVEVSLQFPIKLFIEKHINICDGRNVPIKANFRCISLSDFLKIDDNLVTLECLVGTRVCLWWLWGYLNSSVHLVSGFWCLGSLASEPGCGLPSVWMHSFYLGVPTKKCLLGFVVTHLTTGAQQVGFAVVVVVFPLQGHILSGSVSDLL